MSVIKSLLVKITADSKNFEKKMQTAKQKTKQFEKDVKAMGKAMKLAFVAGAAALGFFVKQQFTAIDKIAKMSRELGISTESLIGLNHAAQLSGTSLEALGKGLQGMSRRLGETLTGVGEARAALKSLGLDNEKLANMGTEAAFLEIADAIGKMENVTVRTNAANKIFGKSGLMLLNLFQEGKIGIREMMEEAEKLGMTFSALDAAKVEEFNDSVTRLKGAFTGLVRQLAIKLAPALQSVADGITAFMKNDTAMWIAKTTLKIAGLVAGLLLVVKTIGAIKIAWLAFNAAFVATPVGAAIVVAVVAAIALMKAFEAGYNLVTGRGKELAEMEARNAKHRREYAEYEEKEAARKLAEVERLRAAEAKRHQQYLDGIQAMKDAEQAVRDEVLRKWEEKDAAMMRNRGILESMFATLEKEIYFLELGEKAQAAWNLQKLKDTGVVSKSGIANYKELQVKKEQLEVAKKLAAENARKLERDKAAAEVAKKRLATEKKRLEQSKEQKRLADQKTGIDSVLGIARDNLSESDRGKFDYQQKRDKIKKQLGNAPKAFHVLLSKLLKSPKAKEDRSQLGQMKSIDSRWKDIQTKLLQGNKEDTAKLTLGEMKKYVRIMEQMQREGIKVKS
jgi:hypothetical protein